jgi:hypothetical protein
MLALVDGHMMDEDTRMYLYLSATSTVIQIQDPIIEDGIWTGFKSLGNGTFQDISAGDHAVAMLKANADGSMNVSYLLLGHPSPRP